MDMNAGHGNHDHSQMAANKDAAQNQSQLKAVFDNHFSVKDALIKPMRRPHLPKPLNWLHPLKQSI